jgi:fatty-acyl-CoA synthase
VELPLTPLDFLSRARRIFASLEGVVDGDRRFTYGEFAGRCDQLAGALRDLGVAPGDRVAYVCGNTCELLEAYYGVIAAGAILTPLNVRLSAVELRDIVTDCSPRVVVVHPDHAALADSLDVPCRIDIGDEYEALLAAQPAPFEGVAVNDERAPAELFYTSGSTGGPKGVVLTHRALYLHAVHSAMTMGFTNADVVLHTIPLFHVNGWGTPHYLTALGGVHVMLRRFDTGEVLRLIEAERVTRLFLVPTMGTLLLEHDDLARRDLSSVAQISVGGAPSTPEMLLALERAFGCEAICGYGMTESAPQMTKSLNTRAHVALSDDERRAKRATTGLPNIGVDLRVLGDDDREVAWDGESVGEICVRSNHVMDGYWNQPGATAEALRGGWLRTGDLAVVDGEGYVTIVDRKKDLVISGGENISTVQVEQVLRAHPAVREAAVVGRADERWGEVPVAFVELRPGRAVGEDELVAWCRDRLAAFKVPKAVTVLEHLPAGGTGKIDKVALRRRVAEAGDGEGR